MTPNWKPIILTATPFALSSASPPRRTLELMILGYNTNGLADVDPVQAIDLVHAIGYRGIALSLDRKLLNPFAADFDDQLRWNSDRLAAARHAVGRRDRSSFLARSGGETRADAGDGRPRRPCPTGGLPLSGGRRGRSTWVRLRFALVRHRPRWGRGPRGDGPAGRRPRGSARIRRTAKTSRSRSSPNPACSSTRWTVLATCWPPSMPRESTPTGSA